MEIITSEEIKKISSNFEAIRNCFDEKYREKLLNHYKEHLNKYLSSSHTNLSASSSRLAIWKFNFQILQKHLELSSSSTVSIIEEIVSNILQISESIVKQCEKESQVSANLREELALKEEEFEFFRLSSENYNAKIENLTRENERLSEELQVYQDELTSALELLQNENKTFLHKIISLSKQTAEKTTSQSSIKTQCIDLTPKIQNNTIIMKNRIAQGRELSLKQLKDTIEEVYSTKVKYDEKCRESHTAIETMDQFMFTYLNQKFGLKTIITEWTLAIMKAVSRHENEDAEVRLFSKIIKHEVNEDFRFVLFKVKEKLKNSLKMCLNNNSLYIRESQVSALLKEKILGKLEEREWTSIVSMMYSQEESEYIIKEIKEGKKVDKGDILFVDLQNVLLGYDMNSHEILIDPFRQAFRDIDKDSDGILETSEFLELCQKAGLEDGKRVLLKIDPFGVGKLNFSICVKAFSEEVMPGKKEGYSVLQNMFFDRGVDS